MQIQTFQARSSKLHKIGHFLAIFRLFLVVIFGTKIETFSGFEPGVFNQAIADQGFTQNTSKLFRQFRWNLVCGSYLAQGE